VLNKIEQINTLFLHVYLLGLQQQTENGMNEKKIKFYEMTMDWKLAAGYQ
jgi:hypothetical protein